MRILAGIVLSMYFAAGAYAEVEVLGEIVVKESYKGCRFFGEVVNNTSTPLAFVRVAITAKNSSGDVLEVAEGHVDGFTYPVTGSDSYVPPGKTVPFSIYGDINPADVATTEVSVTYEELDTEYLSCPFEVTEVYRQPGFTGDHYYGYVVNNTQDLYAHVKVLFVFKDADGRVVDVKFTVATGRGYYNKHLWHFEGLVLPGESAPFALNTFMEPEEYDSYYIIINQSLEKEEEIEFNQHWRDLLYVEGDIESSEYYGYSSFQGAIKNNSGVDVYFVNIETVTRNAAGEIIDISSTYVDGTEFTYDGDDTTDTHIAPGASAPFDIIAEVIYGQAESIEYYITYESSQPPVAVEEQQPGDFRLIGNYPNPFNPFTTIEFEVPEHQTVRICVFSVTGQLLDEIVNDHLAPGIHTAKWDGSHYASGVYLYRILSGSHSLSGSMMLLK